MQCDILWAQNGMLMFSSCQLSYLLFERCATLGHRLAAQAAACEQKVPAEPESCAASGDPRRPKLSTW